MFKVFIFHIFYIFFNLFLMKPRGRKKKISWRGDCPFSEIEETTVFTEMKDIPDSVYPVSIDTGRDHLLVLDGKIFLFLTFNFY